MLAEANMLLCSIVCVVSGYLIGSISFGYLVGKHKKVDIANQGSGNLGATNALRTTGIRGGAATLAGDLLKALIPSLLIKFWLFAGMEGNEYGLFSTDYFVLLTGLAIVLGHDFPFWRKFKGGKGIASSGGVMLVLNLPMSFTLLVMMILVVALTRYVSLASILAAVLINVGALICYPGQWVIIGLVFLYAVLAIWRHHTNITRLLQGKENKISFKKK